MAARRAAFSTAGRLLRASAPAAALPRTTCLAAATRRVAIAPVAKASAARSTRWYSVKNTDPDAIPGSTEWDYEMVARQAGKQRQEDIVLVDVREPAELQSTGKIPSSINIPITTAIQSFHISPEDFEDMYGFERPTKDKELVFYCKAGIRAKTAAGLAKHAGWDKVGVYYGSWLDWEREGGAVEAVKRGEGPQD